MSSPGEEEKTHRLSSKSSKKGDKNPRKKLHRACDFCRRRKNKCDGHEMPGNICTNCIHGAMNCTYFEATRKRHTASYAQSLEAKLANMEKLLGLISSHIDTSKILAELGPADASMPTKTYPCPITTFPISPRSDAATEENTTSEDEDANFIGTRAPDRLLENCDNLAFFGKSSGLPLVQSIMDMKRDVEGTPKERKNPAVVISNPKRPDFWTPPSWIMPTLVVPPDSNYCFPEEDLLLSLVNCYFENVNIFFPLLHRPTYENQIAAGLHRTDDGFGATLILVCALGCRYSEDPRVTHHKPFGADSPTDWSLFHQVKRLRYSRFAARSLQDLQVVTLAVLFLDGSATLQPAWTLVGTGFRFIQQIGAHRRTIYPPKPSIETELWKRAFWVLLILDRTISLMLGRPCALQDEDFDVDLPIECDDEYWTQGFVQPENKPSQMTAFMWTIKLNQILAFALRTIYSIKKSRIKFGRAGKQWDEQIVAELDSAVNNWIDSVPDFLRWDPNRQDSLFFRQSAKLYCSYYELQIVIHRQYSARKANTLPCPSMMICANAARSCCHMVYDSKLRLAPVLWQFMRPIFTCGIVLLLNLWSAKSSGRPLDCNKELENVQKCQAILKDCETRLFHAGRIGDLLAALKNLDELPFYIFRNGTTSNLFVQNYPFLGMHHLPPVGEPGRALGINEDHFRPAKGNIYTHTPDVEENLVDTEELTRLPTHIEQLFGDPCLFQVSDKGRGSEVVYSGQANQEVNPNGGDPLIPVELLMYNDLMGSRQMMDWSSQYTDGAQTGFSSNNMDVGAGPGDMWSNAPTGFDGWGDWSSFATMPTQTGGD